MDEFRVVDTREQAYLYVDKKTDMKPEAISAAMGEAFGEVYGFMQEKGIVPAGAALSVYYTFDPKVIAFRAGFFINGKDASKASGTVKAAVTPAGKALTTLHKGPYSELSKSYDAMMAHMQAKGLNMVAPTWEVYRNDPDTTPESELETELFIALA